MARARKSQELALKLGNKIGAGATLFSKLKESGVNIVASCCYQIGSEAHFTLVPDDVAGAEKVLDDLGLQPEKQEVLLVEIANDVGSFAAVLQEISQLKVSVRSGYATASGSGSGTKASIAVLKTEDDDRVLEELNQAPPPPDK